MEKSRNMELKVYLNKDIYSELEYQSHERGLPMRRLATIAIFKAIFDNSLFEIPNTPKEDIEVSLDQENILKNFLMDYTKGLGYDVVVMNCLTLGMSYDEIRAVITKCVVKGSIEFFSGYKSTLNKYDNYYPALRIKGLSESKLREIKKNKAKTEKLIRVERMASERNKVFKKD